jgi:hypothetical protein
MFTFVPLVLLKPPPAGALHEYVPAPAPVPVKPMVEPEQTVPEFATVIPMVGVAFTYTVKDPCDEAVVLHPLVEDPVTV